MSSPPNRLARAQHESGLLNALQRGIEKEGLRVDLQGRLARTPHPPALGSALTNPRITTDYSEALLELITGTHPSVESLLQELEETHRFVARNLDGELIWNQSMPAELPPEEEIPIGWYGTSNSGMLKHVYRRGLAYRYGKNMQCIAGLHYNFSVPDPIWDHIGIEGISLEHQRTKGYLALIRNFTRYSWLLMYLFGASPAVSRAFLGDRPHSLHDFDAETLYLPWATSLRMSDLGYQNKAQSDLELCYNDLETFLQRMYTAVTTPWPAYERIGTHRNGEWIQLNTNILQIENEYYSAIRPKRSTNRGERPATALAERGVEYIEVRCLDIDPWSPVGIRAESCRFIDAFLLYCAAEPSPFFPANGDCPISKNNFATVVREGRKPGLLLRRGENEISLRDWGEEIIECIRPYAELLDQAAGHQRHVAALELQLKKIRNTELTPSARVLHAMRERQATLHNFTLQLSREHHETLVQGPLEPELEQRYKDEAAASIREQHEIEAADTEPFDEYVARFHAALRAP
ncbi:glutamate--cysteine ligase [Yanghanlia caeni]|uniref:Glutamate--cysteine ligase n=1 Tax=Yanghanlia caeni TaxID=3064283 RepID=A0ABU1D435_9BURK|nr:glutamate--cysteine ligase [Alcaligenaceae bacterium LG-2]NGR08359.1 glutamate--cysteine ligase [bacterium SGD-2]HZH57573.1 glutamate--cysteine ligase [Burkholderiaceae bacterium]